MKKFLLSLVLACSTLLSVQAQPWLNNTTYNWWSAPPYTFNAVSGLKMSSTTYVIPQSDCCTLGYYVATGVADSDMSFTWSLNNSLGYTYGAIEYRVVELKMFANNNRMPNNTMKVDGVGVANGQLDVFSYNETQIFEPMLIEPLYGAQAEFIDATFVAGENHTLFIPKNLLKDRNREVYLIPWRIYADGALRRLRVRNIEAFDAFGDYGPAQRPSFPGVKIILPAASSTITKKVIQSPGQYTVTEIEYTDNGGATWNSFGTSFLSQLVKQYKFRARFISYNSTYFVRAKIIAGGVTYQLDWDDDGYLETGNVSFTANAQITFSSTQGYNRYAFMYREEAAQPEGVVLSDAFPNPMRSTTTIPFTVTKDRTRVQLGIYNIQGQEIQTLVNGALSKGFYEFEWNGKNHAGENIPSGVVIYRLQTSEKGSGTQSQFKKLIIAR